MTSLQISDLPEPLHRLLLHRARVHQRSLSQQAVADLEAMAGSDPRQRRQQTLDRIRDRWQRQPPLQWSDMAPEDLIRADRER